MSELVLNVLFGVVVFLFFVSAFFSSSETALMSVNRLRLRALADAGDKRAQKVLELVSETGRLLSGLLLGNNFANVFLASISTAIAVELWGDLAPLYVSPILTVLLLIFAEIVPKTIAVERSMGLALFCVRPLAIFLTVARPVVALVTMFAAIFSRPFVPKGNESSTSVSAEDLLMLAQVGHEEGSLEEVTHDILHGVYEFAHATVRQVLIPRHEIVSMPLSAGLEGFEQLVRSRGHTRVPVWGENEEDIVGVLHAKDLLHRRGRERAGRDLRAILRQAVFVPESMTLGKALEHMQDSASQMIFVVDEYGGLEGLVTMKDLIEELVGEIEDEHQKHSGRRVDLIRPGAFIADARSSLRYIRRKTGIDLQTEGVSTLGGLLVAEVSDELRPGMKIERGGVTFTVLTMNGRYLKKVRVDAPPPGVTEDTPKPATG